MPKFCKNPGCGKEFTPTYTTLQRDCSPLCALQRSRLEAKKKKEKEWNEEKKAIKEELKTSGEYEADLQKEVNAIVRLIDYGQPCISCLKGGKPQAGHYHSRGANKSLRFNLHNLHHQNYRCNVELSGNITGYNKGLIEWYGKGYQEFVESELPLDYPLMKWTKDDLVGWIKKARSIRRELEKDKRTYGWEERLKMRSEINNRLGIYKS